MGRLREWLALAGCGRAISKRGSTALSRSSRRVGSGVFTLDGVGLLRSVWDEEYWPSFSTVVVRDGLGSGDCEDDLVPAELDEDLFSGSPGTAGRAGVGWFQVLSGGGPHRVGLEVYDAPPGSPGDEWSQLMETPYYSPTGTVGLTNMTDGPTKGTIDLLAAGRYRLQVCSRWTGENLVWLLRWWPDATGDPPRWIRRDHSRYEDRGLDDDIVAVVAWSPGYRLSCAFEELAERLLVPVAEARKTVDRVVSRSLLELDEDDSGDGMISLALPGADDLPTLGAPPQPTGEPARLPPFLRIPVIVGDGDVVRPLPDGRVDTEGGRYDGLMLEAVDTVLGVVVTGGSGIVLLPSGRRLTEHPGGPIAVGHSGAVLAVTEYVPGVGYPVAHAINLETSQRHSHAGTVVGIVREDVFLQDEQGSLRWRPGGEIERLQVSVEHIDAVSGAYAMRGLGRMWVVQPDGLSWEAPTEARTLVPGGGRMCRIEHPSTIVVWDLAGNRRSFSLPADPINRSNHIRLWAWEDFYHLVYALDVADPADKDLFRLDIRDGHIDQIQFPYRVQLFVRPRPDQSL